MLDTITPRPQPVKDQQTGRESIRWVYEDPREGRRLVVGIDQDDDVPIVYSLMRIKKPHHLATMRPDLVRRP